MSLLVWMHPAVEVALLVGMAISLLGALVGAGVAIWHGVASQVRLNRQQDRTAAEVREHLLAQAAAAEQARRKSYEQQQAQWERLRRLAAEQQANLQQLVRDQAASRERLRQALAASHAQWQESLRAFEQLLDELNQRSRWVPPPGARPPGNPARPDTQPKWAQHLGLTLPFTPDELKQAYRRLSWQCHPDVGGTTTQMQELNAARDRAVSWLRSRP